MTSRVVVGELRSSFLPDPVPYAVLTPDGQPSGASLPLCLFLMGGGGSRQNLIDCQPLFDNWWADGSLPPMVVATPSPAMSYYVDDSNAGIEWGAFLADDFPAHVRASCGNVSHDDSPTALFGISMGGYGALKTAFAHSNRFAVVAAMQPMLEPGFRDAEIGARNRLHHLSGGPANLVGTGRDHALFEANNPANRARANAHAIHASGLAIYHEAGDADFVNAHDGTEFLHRVLWDLDLSHEYRLTRGADHGGPTLVPRMYQALKWVGETLTAGRAPTTPADQASRAVLQEMRAQLEPLRAQALVTDPTTARRFGVLPARIE
jgi:S-formylglutathione hydrolase